MKKLSVFIVVLGMILYGASPLWAGGADNKTNWSAEYIRSLNRNAATDSADIVMYNPAGVMKMDDGFYVNFSAHNIDKEYTNKINGVDLDQDEPSVVPGLFAVYKKERWAGIFGVSNVVGGGKVKFENGNATTNFAGASIIAGANTLLLAGYSNPLLAGYWAFLAGATGQVPTDFAFNTIKSQHLHAEQIGLGYTLGGSYKVNDTFSVALAARYVHTTRDMQGTITVGAATPAPAGPIAGSNADIVGDVQFDEEAKGWGALLGLNISPSPELNIGIRYETKVDLDFDQTVYTDNLGILPALGVRNNGERTRNLPAIFGIGVSYQLTPKIRLETDLTYYLNQDAGFDDIPGTPRDESDVDNGFDLGIALEYAFTETIRGSIGYLYTKTGVDAEDMTPELPELDANTLGAGIVYSPTPKVDLNFGVGRVFYDDASYVSTTTGANIEYSKDIVFLAFGIQYKFF